MRTDAVRWSDEEGTHLELVKTKSHPIPHQQMSKQLLSDCVFKKKRAPDLGGCMAK